jgi:hypothetical protein
MHPILVPGTHPLRRSAGELQVGLDPDRAVVLPDSPEVRICLRLLGEAADQSRYDAPAAAVLAALSAHGLVVDADGLTGSPASPSATAALAVRAGARTAAALRQRADLRVAIAATGHPVAQELADELRALLTSLGVPTRAHTRPRRRGTRMVQPPRPGLLVLVAVGEPRRELPDELVRDDVAHLLVRFGEGAGTLGPLVVPGRTACLRCIDAHLTDTDPAWPLLVEQQASAAGRGRRDGMAEPLDPTLVRLVLGWTAREVTDHAERRTPATWSSTLRVGDPAIETGESGEPVPEPVARSTGWLRHPECGCGAQTLARSATMGA